MCEQVDRRNADAGGGMRWGRDLRTRRWPCVVLGLAAFATLLLLCGCGTVPVTDVEVWTGTDGRVHARLLGCGSASVYVPGGASVSINGERKNGYKVKDATALPGVGLPERRAIPASTLPGFTPAIVGPAPRDNAE